MAKTTNNADRVSALDIKRALEKRHPTPDYFATEVKTGSTWSPPTGGLLIFDAIAIKQTWAPITIHGYEIKISRSDFLRDTKYTRYLDHCTNMWMVCPTGLIKREELEPAIGLIYYNPETQALSTKRKAPYREINLPAEMLLYIIMSRLGGEDRYPFHSSKQAYFEDWLDKKTKSRDLGYIVGREMAERLQVADDAELYRQAAAEAIRERDALYRVIRRQGVDVGGSLWRPVFVDYLAQIYRQGKVEVGDRDLKELEQILVERLKAKLLTRESNETQNRIRDAMSALQDALNQMA